jgi:proton glutamate symport protein
VSGATRTLAALLAGLLLGAAAQAWGTPGMVAAGRALAPIGTLWLAVLKMTLVPLIFCLVASGIASRTARDAGGRLVGLAFAVFAGLLVLSVINGAVVSQLILAVWPVAPGGFAGLAPPVTAPPQVPTIVEQIIGMIPTNPVAAAAQGAMGPLVIFALFFGLALGRIAVARRTAVEAVLDGVADAMMQVVDWTLKLAPAGVFVLALEMALTGGVQSAGVLGQVLVVGTAGPAMGIVLSYLVARGLGGVGLLRFARAAIGPQVVAAGTTSSMASLPAMIEAAERRLDCPPEVAGAVLPLAVSTFRFGNVSLVMSTGIFVAIAAGHHPTLGQIAVGGAVAILTNIGIPGLPAAAVFYAAAAPAWVALGAPLEFFPLILALSSGPQDIVTTVCNISHDLAAGTVLQRWLTPRSAIAPSTDLRPPPPGTAL